MSIPDVQKAWVAVKQGTPEKGLQLKTDWPVTKSLQPGEVLVKIKAAALNPAGYKMLKLAPNFFAKRPHVTEYDLAGVIVDENDSSFKKGDEVFGWIPVDTQFKNKQGTLAEYAVVHTQHLALRPQNISVVEAAGVSLAALTAIQALDEAQLEEGQTILINGGSTAVGSFAIQLAKIRGAKVVAVASGKNEEYVRRQGADEFIDYTKVGPVHEYLAKNAPSVKYNVIFEAVALFDPSLYTYSKPYLAPNGVFISVGPQPDLSFKAIWDGLRLATIFLPSFLTGFKPAYRITLVANKKGELVRLAKYLEEGKLKPLVDSVYDFDDVLKAYERILSSRATGKIVVKVDPTVS